MSVLRRRMFQQGGPVTAPEAAAVQQGAQQVMGQINQEIDTSQNFEQMINATRGDAAPIEDRYRELATIVGPEDAMQTPESVLALAQPVIENALIDEGIGGLAQEQMAGPVDPEMTGGIMEMTQPVQQFQEGGPVGYAPGGAVSLSDYYQKNLPLIQEVLGSGDIKKQAQGQALLDIAQRAFLFGSGVNPATGKPYGDDETEAQKLAGFLASSTTPIGEQLAAYNKVKQTEKAKALEMAIAQKTAADAAAAKKYTLGPGEALVSPSGDIIQERPTETTKILKPGEKLFDIDGKLLAVGNNQLITMSEGQQVVTDKGDVIAENKKNITLKAGETAYTADGVEIISKDDVITLGENQVAFNQNGDVIAKGPEKYIAPQKIGPGEKLIGANGKVVATGADRSYTLQPGEMRVSENGVVLAYGPPKVYKIGEGEKVVDGNGKTIAEQGKERVLKPGERLLNADGTIKAEGPAQTITLSEGQVAFQGGVEVARGQEKTIAVTEGVEIYDRSGNLIVRGPAKKFKLSPGETLFDQNGNEIIVAPGKEHILGPGQILYGSDGKEKARGAKRNINLAPGSVVIDEDGVVIGRGDNKVYTLSPGQTAVDSTGKIIAEGGEKLVTLSPGQTLVDASGVVVARGDNQTVTVGVGQKVIDKATGEVIAEGNPPKVDLYEIVVNGKVVDTYNLSDPDEKAAYDAMLLMNKDATVHPVAKRDSTVYKPEYRKLINSATGAQTVVDINSAEGQLLVAQSNTDPNLNLQKITTELKSKAQTFLVDLDKDGIATDIVLSYDQKTFIRKDPKGQNIDMAGNLIPEGSAPVIDNLDNYRAVAINDTTTYQALKSSRKLQQNVAKLAKFTKGVDQMTIPVYDKNANGDTIQVGEEKLSAQDQSDIIDAMDYAIAGTGPWAAFYALIDNVVGGVAPGVMKETFKDTMQARQYLNAIEKLGRSALSVNPKFAVTELNQLSALFPSPDRIFGRPETQAQKYIALKRIAKKQYKRNLTALTEGVLDDTIARNLESKNVEIERLLDLLAGVPEDLPGGLSENVLNDLKSAMKANK